MNLTRRAHEWLNDNLALDDILPAQMPLYVNSVAYLFGVSTLSALGMLVFTGVILALFGPGWYHEAPAGRFFNSLHFWSVQVFFGAMILHLATKFFMAAWRDGRAATWIVGMLVFAVAIFTGLTGYLCQTNWDSQWIAVQAKDAMNAFGVGAFFNTMDTGQVLTLHVVVLPLVIAILTGIHLAQLRRDSPVRPLPEDGAQDEQTL